VKHQRECIVSALSAREIAERGKRRDRRLSTSSSSLIDMVNEMNAGRASAITALMERENARQSFDKQRLELEDNGKKEEVSVLAYLKHLLVVEF